MPALLMRPSSAPKCATVAVDGGLARGRVGDVVPAMASVPAGRVATRASSRSRVQVHRGDACALGRKAATQRGTQTAGGAGDQDDLAGEVAPGHFYVALWRALR